MSHPQSRSRQRRGARAILLAWALLGAAMPSRAADHAEARALWLKGKTAEARALDEKRLPDPDAARGVARTYLSAGDPDAALKVLDESLREHPTNPDARAAKADLLYQRGRWDDALKLAEEVIKENDEHFLARWTRARVRRDQGDLKAADQEMRWFVRAYTLRARMDAEIKDPEQLLIVGQAGAENARWHSLTDQFQFILLEVYGAVLKIEPGNWQAEYLAGAMLLEKMNLPEAVKSFDKALALNPNATEAHVGKGQAALIAYDMKQAEQHAERALRTNPRHPSALRLKADLHLTLGEHDQAERLLKTAREQNPRDESTLARLAAIAAVRRDKETLGAIENEVKAFNPRPGVFYHDLAAAIEERKLYADSERYYRLAIEANDWLAGPKNNLGLLSLRLGKEDEARDQLEKAFAFDPFNVRVANSRKVLKHLAGYATKESAHYILRYDPKTDGVLAEFLLDFLEEVHARLAKDFQYEPEGKTLVEVFNNHEMFSGRTVALPDLHTIGACAGRVVTMVSPRGKGIARSFNWGRVIRHELTHVFNLSQTDFQVPHWLTEGLAVRNEGAGIPPAWNNTLRERFEKNDLFNLDTVLFGFVRPKSQEEWSLAYYQSYLYVTYLIQTHGIEAVGKLLDAYRAGGLDTAGALKKACGIEQPAFEKGYRDFLAKLINAMPLGAPVEKPMTFKELEQARDKTPDDLDIAARLAHELLRRKNVGDARKLTDQVLSKQPTHPLASIVKAKLLTADGKDDEARRVIEKAVAAHPQAVRLRGYYARLLFDAKELSAAAMEYERCRKLDPTNTDWVGELREIYARTEEVERLVDALKEIARNDADDLDVRKELARLLLPLKKPAEAEFYARDALMIDVLDEEARRYLLLALRRQDKNDEADRIAKRFESPRQGGQD
jgi:tetratricopeptide (TPR) repeat protein